MQYHCEKGFPFVGDSCTGVSESFDRHGSPQMAVGASIVCFSTPSNSVFRTSSIDGECKDRVRYSQHSDREYKNPMHHFMLRLTSALLS